MGQHRQVYGRRPDMRTTPTVRHLDRPLLEVPIGAPPKCSLVRHVWRSGVLEAPHEDNRDPPSTYCTQSIRLPLSSREGAIANEGRKGKSRPSASLVEPMPHALYGQLVSPFVLPLNWMLAMMNWF